MRADLHLHTNASDGALSPQALVFKAAKEGFELIAVTDHDTVAGVEEARDAARQYGIDFITGAEFS